MRIGQIYTFDYQSKSTGGKKYTEPVRIKLTEQKEKEIIESFQKISDKAEAEFEKLVTRLTEEKYFDNLKQLKELDDERKARSARARKTKEQKDLELLIEGQYDGFFKKFANENTPPKVKTITDLFFRNYTLASMTLVDSGVNKAILVSKSISKDGSNIYRFITLNPIIVDKSELNNMDGFEYV